ncbi:discoidin domain-containing protein [Pseudorhodoferax sp.]|uniref:discoidin domain-containing protein n=1 Tax=Pseudorhodoferax sp. TaxID=1993553 RepID=UPI002DD68396|nr:discoidin domain-containing protein [Pseudorhodoferax sp.]
MSVLKCLKAMALVAAVLAAAAAGARTLDGFEDLQAWTLSTTDQVHAQLGAQPGPDGQAACVRYDFGQVAGYLALSRALPLAFEGNFALGLSVRGQGAVDSFEIKLVDASGNNVWWHRRARFVPAPQWTPLTTKRRHIEFAWGPTADKALRQTARIELVVVGAQGSRGELCFDALSLTPLPEPPARWAEPQWQLQGGAGAPQEITPRTPWTAAAPVPGRPVVLQTDFGQPREFSGMVLHWAAAQQARRYRIDASQDGQDWHSIGHVAAGLGGHEVHYLPEQEARHVRLVFELGAGERIGLQGVAFLDIGALGSLNALVDKQASFARRGQFPRGFSGEQAYWTVMGVPGGAEQALMSEDGAVEPRKAGPSVEPFVEVGGQLHGWADVQLAQSLHRGYMPIPQVRWSHPRFQLTTTAFASDGGGLQTQVRYRLHNPTRQAQSMTLWLAVRPFQVNPPTQFLNIPGGVAPVHGLAWQDGVLARADGTPLLAATAAPARLLLGQGGAGGLRALQEPVDAGAAARWDDPQGFAAAALQYDIHLPAGASRDIVVVLPQAGPARLPPAAQAPAAWFEAGLQRSAAFWAAGLNRTRLSLPANDQGLADTTRTALAHILINKEGAAIRPGTRSYARSWIRDGAMTSAALASLGYAEVSKDYADWFTPRLFANGKVPCCIDARGADPVPENDSMGAYLYLLANTYRHTGDLAWLRGKWPAAGKVLAYQDALRAEEGEQKNGTPERRRYLGLLPPSISHEGYSDQAAYSYWDDFWGILGYADGAAMAQAVGDAAAAAHWRRQHGAFQRDVLASIALAQRTYRMAVIPGAADRGDTDPTSTTVALAPAGLQGVLPADALRATFDQYWKNFTERRDSGQPWEAYTPYEWRTVGALVRLGERERALAVADYFLQDRRPLGWKQWAEVVSRLPREPRYLGDMPHGWVSSDFLRATMDLFAYEAPERQAWVLGAGVAPAWLQGPGLALRELHTPQGPLSYRARRAGATTTVAIDAGMRLPAGGLVLALPGFDRLASARLDGRPLACLPAAGIVVRQLPAKLQVTAASAGRTLRACPT